jgi:hypothetical protein
MSGRPSLGLSHVHSSHQGDWTGPVDLCIIDLRLRYLLIATEILAMTVAKKNSENIELSCKPGALMVHKCAFEDNIYLRHPVRGELSLS